MNAFAFSHTVVFLAGNPQQNGVWLLTLVSEPVFNALSYGTNHFPPYCRVTKKTKNDGARYKIVVCI